jgi:hypothetical protein
MKEIMKAKMKMKNGGVIENGVKCEEKWRNNENSGERMKNNLLAK